MLVYLYFTWGFAGLPVAILVVLQFVLFPLGYVLRRQDAARLLVRDPRPPILYLRPFRHEALASPGNAPWEKVKAWLVDETHMFAIFIAAIAVGTVLVLAGLGPILGPVVPIVAMVGIAYMIFVLYRRLRGLHRVTLERELGHHFRRLGPFVAVGGPGDWFAPPGAARLYLDDDAWQATVLDYVQRAHIIVVHLVPDGWTWWEFCLCARESSPTRLLAVVAGELLSDADYARLRDKLLKECGITLSEQRGKVDLVTFDSSWKVRYLEIRLIAWIWWPFCAYKIRRSVFRGFVESAAGR
jgi:hypothetical protein